MYRISLEATTNDNYHRWPGAHRWIACPRGGFTSTDAKGLRQRPYHMITHNAVVRLQ